MFALPGKTNGHSQTHECVIPRSGQGVYLSLCYIIIKKKGGRGRGELKIQGSYSWPRDFADIIQTLPNPMGTHIY